MADNDDDLVDYDEEEVRDAMMVLCEERYYDMPRWEI